MSETRATTPAFPPGRYGRRRDGRRRLLLPIAFGLALGVVAVFLTIRLYGTYGHPDYQAQVVGWTDDRDDRITIDFTVRVPAGGTAVCALRALAFDQAVVGTREVTVPAPAAGAPTASVREAIATTAKAVAAEVIRCRAA